MLVEAVVEKGQLRLLKSVRFVHEQVHVVVDIPDNEIVESEIHHTEASALSSSSLIEQLWATRKRAADEESDLLDGIEKKYEQLKYWRKNGIASHKQDFFPRS